MPKHKKSTETVVGLFVLASIGLLLILVILLGREQNIFETHFEIIGNFDSVGGLQAGADVQLAGIKVGFVRSIRFGPDNRVEVIMSINTNQKDRIRQDSVASIKTKGLMGDLYLSISVGSLAKPAISSGGMIATIEPFGFSELFENLRPSVKNLETIINNMSVLTVRLAGSGKKLDEIVENIAVLTAEVRQGRGTIGALLTDDDLYKKAEQLLETTRLTMENFKSLAEKASRAAEELPRLMDQAGHSAQKLEEFSSEAEKSAKGILDMVHAARPVVDDAKTIAANLTQASEDIKEAAHRLGPVIESADEGIREARQVIEAAGHSWLIRDQLPPAAAVKPITEERRDED